MYTIDKSGGPILVLGATGYVGGRLIPRLLNAGYRVRAAGRSIDKLHDRPFSDHPNLEVVRVDVQDLLSLRKALEECQAAFYLIHSLHPSITDFGEADKIAAHNIVTAAAEAGLRRIIYLGGLGEDTANLSLHLRSRAIVGQILQSGSVPTTYLRAAMILGSGSASFEIMRYLVERVPLMVLPKRWVITHCQPIAIRNVLHYLIECLENEKTAGQTYDIGGPEVLTYRDLIDIFAVEAGLRKRIIVPVKGLTARLTALWIRLFIPVDVSIAVPLMMGLSNTVVCKDNRIQNIIPQKLLSSHDAIRLALQRIHQRRVESSWSDAGILRTPEWVGHGDAPYSGGTILECIYQVILKAKKRDVWSAVKRIGGDYGWYYANWLWVVRGLIDKIVGGVGLRRGRRHPIDIYAGDALDFWRVLTVKEERQLHLLAEMKLPGEAILDFQMENQDNGTVALTQIAQFHPKGIWGIFYWYSLFPLHNLIFRGMLKNIAKSIGSTVIRGPIRIEKE